MTEIIIECAECLAGTPDHAEDCLVSFILDRPEGAIVFDAAEERALRALRDGGLLPGVRWEAKRTG